MICSLCNGTFPPTSFSKTQRRKADAGKPSKCLVCTAPSSQQHSSKQSSSSTDQKIGEKISTNVIQASCISLRQPFASLAVHGIARLLNLHVWRGSHVEEMIQPGNLCSPSSSSPFDLWIHAAEETPRPNDVARVRKKYADVNHHWPKTLPTNCVLGRVTVYRILSGAMFLREGGYQLHPPSLQREVFGNNVLVIGNARRLVLPLPHPAPFPSKRGGIWSLPAKLRHSAMQQQPRLSECVHVLTSSEGRGDQERRMLFHRESYII